MDTFNLTPEQRYRTIATLADRRSLTSLPTTRGGLRSLAPAGNPHLPLPAGVPMSSAPDPRRECSTPAQPWPVVTTCAGDTPKLWASTDVSSAHAHRAGRGRHIGLALLRWLGYAVAFVAFTAAWYWLLIEVVSDDRYWK